MHGTIFVGAYNKKIAEEIKARAPQKLGLNNWSWWAGTKEDPKDLFKLASASTVADPGRIKWCDYWPENARVPRVDPFKASVSESDGQSHQ